MVFPTSAIAEWTSSFLILQNSINPKINPAKEITIPRIRRLKLSGLRVLILGTTKSASPARAGEIPKSNAAKIANNVFGAVNFLIIISPFIKYKINCTIIIYLQFLNNIIKINPPTVGL